MFIEGRIKVILLGELLLDIDSVLHLVIILVLESFRYLKQSQKGLIANRFFLILQVVDDVLRHTHVETSFDFVRVSSLEDRSYHG